MRADEDRDRPTALARRIRHALAEVARGGADQMRRARHLRHQELRAARLERADRIERLHLHDEPAAELGLQRLGFVLRRVAKRRVDGCGRGDDVLERQAMLHGQVYGAAAATRLILCACRRNNIACRANPPSSSTSSTASSSTCCRTMPRVRSTSWATSSAFPPSAVQRRLSRYRSSGVIAKQIAVLDPDAVAGTVLACVLVTLERESKKLHSALFASACWRRRGAAVLRPGRRVGLPGHRRREQHAALSHSHRRSVSGCAERQALRDAVHFRARSSAG